MEITLIISILLVSGLVIERIMKHCKKSKCFGSEIEFEQGYPSASASSAPEVFFPDGRTPLNVFRGH